MHACTDGYEEGPALRLRRLGGAEGFAAVVGTVEPNALAIAAHADASRDDVARRLPHKPARTIDRHELIVLCCSTQAHDHLADNCDHVGDTVDGGALDVRHERVVTLQPPISQDRREAHRRIVRDVRQVDRIAVDRDARRCVGTWPADRRRPNNPKIGVQLQHKDVASTLHLERAVTDPPAAIECPRQDDVAFFGDLGVSDLLVARTAELHDDRRCAEIIDALQTDQCVASTRQCRGDDRRQPKDATSARHSQPPYLSGHCANGHCP